MVWFFKKKKALDWGTAALLERTMRKTNTSRWHVTFLSSFDESLCWRYERREELVYLDLASTGVDGGTTCLWKNIQVLGAEKMFGFCGSGVSKVCIVEKLSTHCRISDAGTHQLYRQANFAKSHWSFYHSKRHQDKPSWTYMSSDSLEMRCLVLCLFCVSWCQITPFAIIWRI